MITELIKNYIKLKFDKIIERDIDKLSSFVAVLMGLIFIMLSCLLFFLFSTFALALFLAEYLGKNYYGFLAIAFFYLIIGYVFWLCRDIFIKQPLAKMLDRAFKNTLKLPE
jgi:hypothetical protein